MHVSCDSCQMLSINGIPCHESGCPNQRKTWVPERGWVRFVPCPECGSDVELGETCDCQEAKLDEVSEFVASHNDDDEIDHDELVRIFRLAYDREPDDEDHKNGLWSLICAAARGDAV